VVGAVEFGGDSGAMQQVSDIGAGFGSPRPQGGVTWPSRNSCQAQKFVRATLRRRPLGGAAAFAAASELSLPILDEVNELIADVQRSSKASPVERALNRPARAPRTRFGGANPGKGESPGRGPRLPVIPMITRDADF
jgi:hypothetical protein